MPEHSGTGNHRSDPYGADDLKREEIIDPHRNPATTEEPGGDDAEGGPAVAVTLTGGVANIRISRPAEG
jgi:hypothetical protein